MVLAIQIAFVVPAVVLWAVAEDTGRNEPQLTVAGVVLLVTGWIVSVCYEVASTHLGGGPGKRSLQLRVVTEDASVLPVRASIARWALVTGVQPLVWGAVGVVLADATAVRVACGALVTVSLLWRAGLAATIVRGDGTVGWHDRRVGSRVTPPRPDEVGTTDDLPTDDADDLPTATVPR